MMLLLGYLLGSVTASLLLGRWLRGLRGEMQTRRPYGRL
jgi:glycerol-3-phosphate acyltransferase PlsY